MPAFVQAVMHFEVEDKDLDEALKQEKDTLK